MMNLAEYRRKSSHLADFLPWAALVGTGVVVNKDGSFQRTAQFRGPDLDSAVPAELVAIAGRINNALRRLGSHVDKHACLASLRALTKPMEPDPNLTLETLDMTTPGDPKALPVQVMNKANVLVVRRPDPRLAKET